MSNAQAKPAIREDVIERVKACKCLIADCDGKVISRGLCPNHYSQFLRERDSRPESERAGFETEAIREGLVLPSGAVREIKSNNPFAAIG